MTYYKAVDPHLLKHLDFESLRTLKTGIFFH